LRRIVAVVALATGVPARVAAARVRLNAITASTSQAAFAVNLPDGRWARAEFFRSAWTCSMIAWPRWVLSAVMVSRVLVVKKPWKRQVSNRVAWPALACGLRSGIRRTTSRPGTWSFFFCAANAVNGISATSAREIQRLVVWSKTASVYSIGAHPSTGMAAMAALTLGSRRTVTETCAPARTAARTAPGP
jgi:hypothetical protein